MKFSFHNSLRALFLSLAVLLSLPMLAVRVEIDGINYELVSKLKQATVIAKSSGKYSGEAVIPESVEHEGAAYSVTSVGWDAFYDCSGLTSVTIPNSVTSIGYQAFYGCSGLTSVHISDIVAWCNIDFSNYANPLYYAHHLYLNGEEVKDLVIPDGVKSIGEYAFRDCTGLTSVTIPNSVTSIGDGAFYYCSSLTSVTIPNSVTSIGGFAFSGCSGLTSVTIPNSVTSIGYWAFKGCSGLTSVSIPNSVTSIGEHTFFECSSLTSVTIPNSVTSIGYQAFYGCSGLTSVTIPNSVTSIGEEAFYKCSGLTSMTIGNGVTSIGNYAFYGCTGLLNVYCYAENVSSTGSNVFSSSIYSNATLHVPAGSIERYKAKTPWSRFGNIVGIPTEVDGINYDFDAKTKHATVTAKSSGKYSGEVVIPESVEYVGATYCVTSIGKLAFSGCSGLTSVTIPNSVTSIGSAAFYYCSGLTSVTIGNSVTSIGYQAFEGCSGLTSVTIPNSVTSIGACAFWGCSGLTSVTIPNSVTSIGNDAFWGCSSLTSVTIPNSVTSIGEGAFCRCPELLDVYCYAEKVPFTYSNAFYGSYPEYATLHVPGVSIDSYKATEPWSSFGKIVALTEEETGIDELKGENGKVKTAVYDLSGRRVQKAQKGIFIQNGKVMIQ